MPDDLKTAPQLADFEGKWHLSRVIQDRRADTAGRFDGQALFVPVAGGLAYRETGTLTLDGQSFQAERRYFWHAVAGGIAVTFEDGRPFHRIGPGPRPEDTHDCAPDRYAVRYDFSDWPGWTAVWRVAGPRKDYTMTSRYRRG